MKHEGNHLGNAKMHISDSGIPRYWIFKLKFNIESYMSSFKMSSSKSHPGFKYYMGTDDIEDLVSFSKTPAGRMEKRIKEEAEALLHLELQRTQAKATLMDGETIRSDIRVFRRYLEKLEAATNKYEHAISDLIVNSANFEDGLYQ